MTGDAIVLPRLETADPAREVARIIRRIRKAVRRYATAVARGDSAIVDDLVQEGYIALWITDPTRIGFKTIEQQDYLWHYIRVSIRAAFRKHRKQTSVRWRPVDRVRGLAWRIADPTVGLNGVSLRRKIREQAIT